jgi:hypothetical protein
MVVAVALGCLLIGVHGSAGAFPVDGDQTALPPKTELNEDALDKPREIFRSESGGGGKSYLVNLGNLAFSSPGILGGVATGRRELRHLPCQRRGQRDVLHAKNVDAPGQF